MVRFIKIMTIMLGMVISTKAQNKQSFVLNAKIQDLNDATLYLINSEKDTVEVIKAVEGKFSIRGSVEGGTNFYFLRYGRKVSNGLWFANSEMFLSGNIYQLDSLTLSGSIPHMEYIEANKILKNQDKEQRSLAIKKYLAEHTNSLYVPRFIIRIKDRLQYTGMKTAYNNLSNEAKFSYWGRELAKEIETLKKLEIANQGTKKREGYVQNFEVTDSLGKTLSILELAAKAKYTLLDFWASWCSPCRAAIPKLSKVYEAFHAKGFNIVGISRDKSEVSWKKAMIQDNAPWTNGLDNVDDAGSNLFGLKGIPAYLLIDKEGKIIQSDLTSGSFKPIKQFPDKDLLVDLYQIIEQLLKDEKSK